ncbi:MAG: N-acetylneuraminate synthase family protein [Sediminibacterium sp.]|uniref:N-acetylneuraminate synthase family protein n=1 Tax=Sediminibacterium sp. TaxID=1917865 RepID=UPI002725454E|nr:N-acetylneuraminate synthase family protein [Sediminibacterium sp.]MDO8997148.1 N-acetylneuraminate synthase family protein [Sediminibacterium sp.]
MKDINFGNRTIGNGHPLYFIADIGANHDGDLNKAFKLIELAKEAGADAAKFQNFKAAKIVSRVGFENLGSHSSHQSSWKKSVYEVYEDASISLDWTPLLKAKCDEVGIDFFTSPYDFGSVDAVDPYVNLYKIGSGDITWLEIIKHIAKKNKPVLLATGASEMSDVVRAMNTLESINNDIVLMQCNTNYTVDKEKYKYVNLKVLETFSRRFPNVILGLSDHTIGHATVLGAVALGALVIEKHFTDNNENEGPDHKFAMNPKSWSEMVKNANEVYHALGDGIKKVEQNENNSLVVQRRALRSEFDLKKGHIITEQDIVALRPIPLDGIPPYLIHELIGKVLTKNIIKGEHFTLKHF